MKLTIFSVIIILLIAACAQKPDNEIGIEYNPALVGDVLLLDHLRAQPPVGWSALSDSLKTRMFGDTNLHVFVTPDMAGLMHIAPLFGDIEPKIDEMRAVLEQQAPDGLRYDTFDYKNQTYHQFVVQAGDAVTYQLFVVNADGSSCAATYTVNQSIFETEIKKIESSIASILLD